MQPTAQTDVFLQAIRSFQGRFLVVAPDFRIRAAGCGPNAPDGSGFLDKRCHEVVCDRPEPCPDCAVRTVLATRKPAWGHPSEERSGAARPGCHFAYPIEVDGRIEAVAVLEIDPPPHTSAQEQLQRSNALLRNLIVSCVDGVIAADKTGKVIIFNEAASQIFGYPVAEALDRLDVRRIYPDGREREIMRQLRSSEHGGPGKLHSYTVEVLHRDGTRIPINLNAAIVYEGGREVATIGFFRDLRGTGCACRRSSSGPSCSCCSRRRWPRSGSSPPGSPTSSTTRSGGSRSSRGSFWRNTRCRPGRMRTSSAC